MTETAKKVQSYRDLRVWQKGMDLVALVYRITRKYPPSETYGLTAQTRRAAVSVPANIAEGHGRRHLGDYLHHISVANGSLKELETHLFIGVRLGYVKQTEIEFALSLCEEVGRMLTMLRQRLAARQR